MIYIWKYITLAVSGAFILFNVWLCLASKGKYSDLFAAVDKKIFLLRDFMSPGIYLLEKLKFKKNPFFQKRQKLYYDYFGKEKGEFYLHCALACGISSFLFLFPIGNILSVLADEPYIIVFSFCASIAIALYPGEEIRKGLKARKTSIVCALSDVLARLSLLTGAGLVLREAIEKTAYSAEGELYSELRKMISEINNGVSDSDALYNLSHRCGVKEISHFASVLSQNLSNGGNGIAACLKYLNEESWCERKNKAKIIGQTASQKLMIPLMMMFIGILAMIIIPLIAEI